MRETVRSISGMSVGALKGTPYSTRGSTGDAPMVYQFLFQQETLGSYVRSG